MKPQLNHTIVAAKDQRATTQFLVDVLGFEPPVRVGHFLQVETGNGFGLDVLQIREGDVFVPQHYAFLVTEREFDEIMGRIRERDLDYRPEPRRWRSSLCGNGLQAEGESCEPFDDEGVEEVALEDRPAVGALQGVQSGVRTVQGGSL